jgi:hypothetical protein
MVNATDLGNRSQQPIAVEVAVDLDPARRASADRTTTRTEQ